MSEGGWWYVAGGGERGPVTVQELEGKLVAGEISPATPVWQKGMPAWVKMSEVEELADMVRGYAPPASLPGEAPMISAAAEPLLQPAGLWSRYAARQIDIGLFSILGLLCLGFFFPSISHDQTVMSKWLLVMAGPPIAMILEVPIYGLLGWTLGKWMLGITVRRDDGARPGFSEIWRRNLGVWIYGLGLGIPIVSFFTMIQSYRAAEDGKRNVWDDRGLLNVRQRPIGSLRRALGIAFCFILIGSGGILGAHLAKRQFEQPSMAARTWTNPVTNVRMVVFDGWHQIFPEQIKNKDVFSFEGASSSVILGRETYVLGNIDSYVSALLSKNNFWQIDDKKKGVDVNGLPYYLIHFHGSENNSQYVADLKVWQTSGANFWRSFVFSPLKNEKARAEARAFADKLDKTSLIETGGRN